MNTSETAKFRFTENELTPIVRDFNTFVNYIEDTPFAIGKKAGHIPYRHLVELNEEAALAHWNAGLSEANHDHPQRWPEIALRLGKHDLTEANTVARNV